MPFSHRASWQCAVVLAACATMPAARGLAGAQEDKKPSLSLKATPPLGFSPLRVRLVVDVRGGADDYDEFYCPADRMGLGRRHRVRELGGLRPLPSRHQHHQAAVLRRARLPAGGHLPRVLPAEAEGQASWPPRAPTSRCARASATILATETSRSCLPTPPSRPRGRRDGGCAGPCPRAAPRRSVATRRSPPSTTPSSSPKSSACCTRAWTSPASHALLLPELLGDPATWRLETAIRYDSHRGSAAGGLIIFVKKRLVLPLVRWLFEYSRDNFERQRRVNAVLFACVQELALETASSTPRPRPPPVKLACVVQRYGADIAGGSERIAGRWPCDWPRRHDVTVLTTCSRDYVTWANAYPPGETRGQRRARAALHRAPDAQAGSASPISATRSSTAPRRPNASRSWFAENGPDVPALLDHLRAAGHATTTWCCSGPSATPELLRRAARAPTAPCWCRPRRRIAPST